MGKAFRKWAELNELILGLVFSPELDGQMKKLATAGKINADIFLLVATDVKTKSGVVTENLVCTRSLSAGELIKALVQQRCNGVLDRNAGSAEKNPAWLATRLLGS